MATSLTEAPRFVVQKHAARRLHYDVRLEVDGVMASWAVPKGPSYDPAVRRLAVHVEDHELEHRSFEGIIPGARYGPGAVIIWDEGTYTNESSRDGRPLSVRAAIDKGHVTVVLAGVKLHGGWHLVRTAPGSYGADSWLLIKRRDDEVDALRDIEAEEPASVRSGLTIEEIGSVDSPNTLL